MSIIKQLRGNDYLKNSTRIILLKSIYTQYLEVISKSCLIYKLDQVHLESGGVNIMWDYTIKIRYKNWADDQDNGGAFENN